MRSEPAQGVSEGIIQQLIISGNAMKYPYYLTILVSISLLAAAPAFAKQYGKSGSMPPGVQKKYYGGEPLPPGWQKKLRKGDILDNSIYMRGRVVVPLGKDGSISINVDGTVLRLHETTRRILDIH